MRLRPIAIAAVSLAGLTLGCKHTDLVEAELRHQTYKLEQTESELQLRQAEIHTLRATVDSLRCELEQRGSTAPPETIYRAVGLAKVDLGPLTGVRDFDRDGRADGFQVAIVPRDYDGDVFKCPGSAVVRLVEFTPSGGKRPLGQWEIDQAQLKLGWRVSLLGQGYQIVLPWQEEPTQGKLRAVVQFRTLDGRQFEGERDFEMKVPTGTEAAAPDLLAPEELEGDHEPIEKAARWKTAQKPPESPKKRWQDYSPISFFKGRRPTAPAGVKDEPKPSPAGTHSDAHRAPLVRLGAPLVPSSADESGRRARQF